MKFHINKENIVRPCEATLKECPFEHFDTKVEAEKEVQARMMKIYGTMVGASESEREAQITARLKAHRDFVESQGYEVAATMLRGSQNYGLDIYEPGSYSDVDTVSVIIPSTEDIINGHVARTAELAIDGEHADIVDIRTWFEGIQKQSQAHLEPIFSDYKNINENYRELVSSLEDLGNTLPQSNEKAFIYSILGTAKAKRGLLLSGGDNHADLVSKLGYNPKELHHLMRMENFLSQYLSGTDISKCYKPTNRTLLLKAKRGEYSKEDAVLLATNSMENIDKLISNAAPNLRSMDYDALDSINDIKVKTMKQAIIRELSI